MRLHRAQSICPLDFVPAHDILAILHTQSDADRESRSTVAWVVRQATTEHPHASSSGLRYPPHTAQVNDRLDLSRILVLSKSWDISLTIPVGTPPSPPDKL